MSMSDTPKSPPPGTAPADADAPENNPRRWLALVFIGLAQLMIVLDITIVNIALPSVQDDLAISGGDRQWVVTAYTLAFGSLLLLGGRIADYTGRKRAFLIGLVGFAGASALGGAAGNFELLLTARSLQGVFAALLAPTALSLLTISFTEPRERAKAFGVFGAIAAGGGAVGLVVGGLLTEHLDWRWCFYVNVPIALAAAFGWYVLPSENSSRQRARLDLPGVFFAVTGLVAVVYGCSEAESEGWDSGLVLGLLTLGVVLLAAFTVVESRTAQPLLPLRVIADRSRGSAYLAIALAVIGMFGMFLLLTFHMQVVMDYGPVLTGLAFLPLTVGVLAGAGGVATRLLPKVAPRTLIAPGLFVSACGTGWLIFLEADSSYAAGVLPAELLVGFGMGLVMAPAMNYATHGVRPEDAGIAAATANTSQQVGGSIGTALLNTVAISATSDYLADRPRTPQNLRDGYVEGFSSAYTVATVLLIGAAALIAVLMNAPRPRQDAQDKEAAGTAAVHMG